MSLIGEVSFRTGKIAVLGLPNAGKSTLINALVGQKVSIVAPRPQTTRHRLLGIVTQEDAQFILIDTPGLHEPDGKAINRYLNRAARGAASEADVNLLVLDASAKPFQLPQALLDVVRGESIPVIVALNKIDQVKQKDLLLPLLAQIQSEIAALAIVPISALTRNGLSELLLALKSKLPIAAPEYDDETITNKSVKFLAAEMVREQLMRQLRDEVPYSATVEIEEFLVESEALTHIQACIWVEREGQKAIVIGKGGAQLKNIGSDARKAIEKMLETQVFLKLWVRVREGWSDDAAALRRFGYED